MGHRDGNSRGQVLDWPSRMKVPKPNVQGYSYRVILVYTAISSQ